MNDIEAWLQWERNIPEYFFKMAAQNTPLPCSDRLDDLLLALSDGRTGLVFEFDKKSSTIKSNYDLESAVIAFPLQLSFIKDFYDLVVSRENYLNQD